MKSKAKSDGNLIRNTWSLQIRLFQPSLSHCCLAEAASQPHNSAISSYEAQT
jgi:hypothetical protein